MIAYKLLRVRRDGTLGPLFINRKQRIEVGVRLKAEDHPTKGYAHRPGWHVCQKPHAPHLSTKGRRWYRVRIENVTRHQRPEHQGGVWYTAGAMTALNEVAA
ncbi:MAG: hypothetical protein KDK08_05380 [Rhizobiaceae bacterium]|nr:hypothetical protein [Rhizobiaceae bacterium]MCC0000901.1 hypothetical protein [Methylobacteriaceae bacterium]